MDRHIHEKRNEMFIHRPTIYTLAIIAICASLRAEPPLESLMREVASPYEPTILREETLDTWTFDGPLQWRPAHDCQLSSSDGHLKIESTGTDPYCYATQIPEGRSGQLLFRMRARSSTGDVGQIFWITREDPHWGPERCATFRLHSDGEWHDYLVPFDVKGSLQHLRLDPGGTPGLAEIDTASVSQRIMHPLEIVEIVDQGNQDALVVRIKNHSANKTIPVSIGCEILGIRSLYQIETECPPGESSVELSPIPMLGIPFQSYDIRISAEGLQDLVRSVHRYDMEAEVETIACLTGESPQGDVVELLIDSRGSGAELRRNGRVIGIINPLLQSIDRSTIPLNMVDSNDTQLVLEGVGKERLTISLDPNSGEFHYELIASEDSGPLQGPTVHVLGGLEQGLLAGVEYLGRGERSSSKLDVVGPESDRFTPPPMHLTIPLMAYATDRGSIAMTWDDTTLQPIFATPNVYDATSPNDHLMGLQGRTVSAVIRLGPAFTEPGRSPKTLYGGPIEDAIVWAVQRRGLPELPAPPRSPDQQDALSLQGFTKSGIFSEGEGWRHAYIEGNEDRFGARYHADAASSIWELTGEVPETPELVHGGAHLRNPAAYFLTDRAQQWTDTVNRAAQSYRNRLVEDGSIRYNGEYQRGHFENTTSGQCGVAAWTLLTHAQITGNTDSQAAGLHALSFINTHFRTPRGAQVWECPLHTPDIMAAAWCCHANVMAYELTDEPAYIAEARRWAVTGLPFVYQWGEQPIMRYATTSVLGATNWRAPYWIGLPVQWCGIRYADAIAWLAPYDDTIDWAQVSRGILHTAEQMQYPEGSSVGCLPDVFRLDAQTRHPADINPGALVVLRRRLDGEPVGLQHANIDEHVVAGPFPMTPLEDGTLRIDSKEGTTYQIVIDGTDVRTIEAAGRDILTLD
jgi:hypothetical protein